jgi:hypothetical protein
MSGAIHPFPQYAFMAWCPVKAQGHHHLYILRIDPNREKTKGKVALRHKYVWRSRGITPRLLKFGARWR